MYESQQPSANKTVSRSSRISSIVSLVASVFPEEEITKESSMINTDSWDSLGHMQVIIALKEEMNIELSPSEIAEATSIELIAGIINEA
jgi:acyl carrier protein